MKKTGSRPLKILLIVLCSLLAIFIAAVVGLNVYMRVSYSSFYNEAKSEFSIPGTSEGFIVQDMDYLDADGLWLFSGYTSDGSASPIYKRDSNGNVSRIVAELPDGSVYSDHGSGITSDDNHVFLTCEMGYLAFDADEIANASDGDVVRASERRELEFSPAFMNIENGRIYTGQFYLEGPYNTPEKHHLTSGDGTLNHAIMYEFSPSDDGFCGFAHIPDRVFSIPEKTQGVCVTQEDIMVLSTSWGIGASHLFSFDISTIEQEGTYNVDGEEVPLYFLDGRSLIHDLAGPPMFEGIEYHDGRIFIPNEAASNKYIFGKFYGSDVVFSLVESFMLD